MQQISSHGATRLANHEAADAILYRRPFTNANGSLSAGIHAPASNLGELPTEYHDDYQAAMSECDLYVVYSYGTPIAWFSNCDWHLPEVRYSVTTSKHQAIVRKAIA